MLLPCGGFTKAGQIPVLIFSLSPVSSSHTTHTPLCRSVSLWGGDLLACEPREFPDAFGYGILGEERSGWCVPHICTNTAVEESGNATCRRKPAFRPVGTDSYRSKFCWFAVYGSPWYTAPCPSLLLVPWTLHGAVVPTSC